MALKKSAKKQHQSRRFTGRLPGETDEQWTARNARLERNATGKWVVKYTEIVTHPDGTHDHRTNERSTRETDRAEAETYLADWREMYVSQRKLAAPRLTFQDVVESYCTTRAKRFTNTNDIVARKLCAFLGNDPVDTINRRRMDELHVWLTGSGKAPGTVRKYLAGALTILNHAAKHDMMTTNPPRYQLPSAPPPRPHALTETQKEAVFHAAAAWGQDTRDPVKLRTGLFTCIALETAQRREAILDLTWERVNLTDQDRPTLEALTLDFMPGKPTPKNKRRCAAVPISDDLLTVLKRAALAAPRNPHGEPTGPVFPCRLIVAGFKAFREHMNMPAWFTPHVFRHTWVTLAWSRMPLGVISVITGDNIATLERTYAHLRTDTVREHMRRHLWMKAA